MRFGEFFSIKKFILNKSIKYLSVKSAQFITFCRLKYSIFALQKIQISFNTEIDVVRTSLKNGNIVIRPADEIALSNGEIFAEIDKYIDICTCSNEVLVPIKDHIGE